MKNIYLTVLCVAMLFSSCSKKDDVTPDFNELNLAQLSVEFDNIVGDRTLAINNSANLYTNAAREKFSISSLQYFISNLEITTTAGKVYVVNQDSSYFLISGADKATRFAKVRVPEGDYSRLKFTLGVDSLRSTMPLDKRTGVLDPAYGGGHDLSGMYWGWNSGYIFFKFEGNADVISNDVNGDPTGKHQFKYHIGGFGGYSAPTLNNIKTVTMDLNPGGIAKVRTGRQSNIHVLVDLMKAFNGTNNFSIAAHPTVMFSDFSTKVAANLTEMFKHDHTEN
jgi:hypothetical protein